MYSLENYVGALLRLRPGLTVTGFDDLTPVQQEECSGHTEDPEFFGLLVTAGKSGVPDRALSRDAALLLQTLVEPRRVPHLLTSMFGDDAQRRVMTLILDGVLEIERNGDFILGPEAVPALPAAANESGITSRIDELSIAALRYGLRMEGLSIPELAARLYLYNRIPATADMLRDLHSADVIEAYIAPDLGTRTTFARDWQVTRFGTSWLVGLRVESDEALAYKLYISPDHASLPEVFVPALESLKRNDCHQFKIGSSVTNLMRADKFVAYFPNFDAMYQAARCLLESLPEVPAQGVPFTGAIDPNGLVSWGMDPPRASIPGYRSVSWREWVAERIATCLSGAIRPVSTDPVGFVKIRLALEGVDVTTWAPTPATVGGWRVD